MRNRGILTEDDRDFYRGDKQPDDPDAVRREKRHNISKRIAHIVEDLELLTEAGETDLVDEFHRETDRDAGIEDLEAELANIRDHLSAGDEDDS
jgi:hypothetical protein